MPGAEAAHLITPKATTIEQSLTQVDAYVR